MGWTADLWQEKVDWTGKLQRMQITEQHSADVSEACRYAAPPGVRTAAATQPARRGGHHNHHHRHNTPSAATLT